MITHQKKIYLSVQEAAKELGISLAWTYEYIRRGKLKKYKVLGKTYLLKEEVDSLKSPQPVQ